MSKIQTSQQGAILTLDSEDWIAGLSVNGQFTNPAFTSPALSKGAEKLIAINPFTAYGVLQPGRAATNVVNNSVLGGVVVAGVIQGPQYAYLADASGKIHKYDYANSSTNGLINAGVFPNTIAGTTPVAQDIVVYKHNISSVPTFSAFYSYYNSTDWNVGAITNFTAFDDDYMSTIPATPLTTADSQDTSQRTAPHCLEVGSDDVLYIGSGRYLHAFDGSVGADGTFYARVLTLPAGFTVVALKKYQNVMLIAGNYNTDTTNNIGGEALLYVWNYIDLDITQAVPLEDSSVVSLFLWKGIPHVICIGEKEGRGTTKLKALSGNNISLISTFNLPPPPINRGVDASSDVLFINCGGYIVQIGDPYTGDKRPTHHITTTNSATVSGWIKNIGTDQTGNTNYGLVGSSASVVSGGTNSLCTLNTNWQTTCLYRHPYQEIPCPPGKKAKLKNIIIENFRTFTLADLTLTVNYDYGNSTSTIFTNTATLAAPLTKQFKLDYLNNPLKNCTNISFDINWGNIATASSNPPAISRMHFIFEYLDLAANT